MSTNKYETSLAFLIDTAAEKLHWFTWFTNRHSNWVFKTDKHIDHLSTWWNDDKIRKYHTFLHFECVNGVYQYRVGGVGYSSPGLVPGWNYHRYQYGRVLKGSTHQLQELLPYSTTATS